MLLQYQILVLNDAKASHDEVRAFRSEPCRLFQSAPHAVFYSVFCFFFFVFFYSVFTVTLMCAGLPYMGISAIAHSAVLAPSPSLLRHRCNLLSASGITVSTLFEMAPIKCFFQVNEGQLTLLNFPKEASTRQKLRAFLFLVDLFRVDLLTSST